MRMTLTELAEQLGAELTGPGDITILGPAGVRDAGEGYITFITGPNHLKDLESSKASAALVPLDMPAMKLPVLRVRNPKLAFAQVIELFHGKPYQAIGISEKAVIHNTALIGSEPSIHPFVVIEENVRIGDRVTLYPGVYIGRGSTLGDECIIHPHVCIEEDVHVGKRAIIHAGTVLGSDGFGFVTDGGTHHKIPQVGSVIIEDDVELGSNCTVDRATLGHTTIKKGTKIDNQVHIAHNVTIGEHCLLAGQVGIAGSSTLGKYVVIGGQAGVSDHTMVGDQVMIGGGAAVTRDVEPGQVIAGINAMPIRDWLKVQAVLPKLPELKKLIAALEKQIKELKTGSSA